MSKKTFVLDTSVSLYDKTSIHSFPGANVVIPLIVLDELDRKKEARGLLGENARYVNRFLDELRLDGSLTVGVTLEHTNQTIRVEFNKAELLPPDLSHSTGDNKILGVALDLVKKGEDVTIVTKDINFRVKCDALGILCEDYKVEQIVKDRTEIFTGFSTRLID